MKLRPLSRRYHVFGYTPDRTDALFENCDQNKLPNAFEEIGQGIHES